MSETSETLSYTSALSIETEENESSKALELPKVPKNSWLL